VTLAFPNQYFLGLSGLTQGGWDLQATELRCGATHCSGTIMLYGAGQWGAPSGQGPNGEGNGAQVYAQYAPPSGPLALECQMPPYEPAVEAVLNANFPSSGACKACAAVDNGLGYGRVWTREDTTNSWQPTTIWNNTTGASVQVRSLFAYTDSQTGVSYLFAGSDDTNGLGGIFHATYNANASGNLVWDSTPELEISATNSGASFTARYDLPTASLVVTGVSAGALGVNMGVTDVGGFLPAGCMITGQTTGTQGGIGSYTISPAPTAHIAPEAMTASVTLPSGLNKRVMSIASGPNTAGGTSLYATVGIQVWERVDGASRPIHLKHGV